MKASDVLKRPPLPRVKLNSGPPIKASELIKRRADEAAADLQRAIDRRERLLIQLTRLNVKIWALGKRVKSYDSKLKLN